MEKKNDWQTANMKPIKVVVCDDDLNERSFFVDMCKTVKHHIERFDIRSR